MANWFSDNITKVTDKEGQSTDGQKTHFRRVANEIFTAKQKEGLTSSVKGKMNLQKNWFEKIMQHGSTRDRVSLQYKLLSENPIPRAKYLDSLIFMVNPAKKRDCLMAMDLLRRLFLMLLPKSRPLIPFDQRPLHVLESLAQPQPEKNAKKEKKANTGSRLDAVLLLWIFEDQLRKQYATFITNLENVAIRDNLEQNKKRAIGVLFDLIVNKPELRKRIIKILVNKVGDPSRKLASHAKHKLLLAVNEKHVFVPEFVDEFEAMLYRSNISEKAQYFVMCCLNSMFLRKKKANTNSPSDAVPLKLVKIYCSFFDASLDKGKVIKRKMLNAILSGISRAFPFLSREEVNLHLQPHVNSLFRLVHTACSFNQAVQTLMVLFHFMKHQDDLKDRFYQALYRKLADFRLIRRSGQRQALLLHLLFRALQEDDNSIRLQAFAKRLLTLCLHSTDTPLICGLLLMLSELKKIHPDITTTKQMTSKKFGSDGAGNGSDSDEEFFSDIDSDLEEEERAALRRQRPKVKAAPNRPVVKGYDPTARDPRHSGADKDCTWELLRLQNFFHPSVRVFAQAILTDTPISYSGDPFADFTLIHFLERFLQKKPKRDPAKTKAEAAPGAKELATNSAEYRSLPEEAIPEDEKCFYEFSKAREARQAKRRKREVTGEEEDADDHDSVPDEEFDAYLDKFEDKLDDIPLDGLSDSGSDLGLSSGEEDEVSFTMSDLSSEEGGEEAEGKEDEDEDEEFDEDALVGDDDDDDLMEVDEDDEDDDDEREMFESDDESDMDFDGQKETPRQRKQRQWEEQRTSSFDFGGKKGARHDRSRSPFRDQGGNQADGGRRGGSRGRGFAERGGGYRGRGGGSFGEREGGYRGRGGGPRGRGGGSFGERGGGGFRGRGGGSFWERGGYRGRGGGGFRGRGGSFGERGGGGFRGRGRGSFGEAGARGRGGLHKGRGREGGRGGGQRGRSGSRDRGRGRGHRNDRGR